MTPHSWKEDMTASDGVAGYRTMRCSVCGRLGYWLHGERRDGTVEDGTVEVGGEPVHVDLSSLLLGQVPIRDFTPEEKDCDLERVRQVMAS